MKKNIMKLSLAIMAMVAMFTAGCAKNSVEQTFIVGFDASFPPYGFISESGEYVGFDLDLAAEVAKRNGWKLVKKPIDWAAKDAELDAGKIDCIWNGFTLTEERKSQYTWTKPYVENAQLILVRTESSINAVTDLNGKKIVVQDGSSGATAMEDFLKEQQAADSTFAFADYKKVPDYNTAYTMLKTDAVDAIGLDSAVAKGYVDKSNGEMRILETPLCSEFFAVGFKLGNTELRDTVEKTLMEMVADGTCAKIIEKWKADTKNGGDGIDFILK